MAQRHGLELKEADKIVAAGFTLFKRFRVMAMMNETRGGYWSNTPWLQIALGVFIMTPLFLLIIRLRLLSDCGFFSCRLLF